MRAALYLRVSKEERATQSVSLEAQEQRLRHYCASRGDGDEWHVGKVYRDDGFSGKTLERPAFQQLMEDAKARKFEVVLAHKLDRFTRSVRDLGTLLEFFTKRRVALISLSESFDATTAVGRLTLNLLGSIAQWEREAIGERTSTALQYRRSQLQAYGETPFGFKRVGDRLQLVEHELATIRRIYALRQDKSIPKNERTLRAIAAALNADRIRTKKGKKWAAEQVRYILANDLYQPYVGQSPEGRKHR